MRRCDCDETSNFDAFQDQIDALRRVAFRAVWFAAGSVAGVVVYACWLA